MAKNGFKAVLALVYCGPFDEPVLSMLNNGKPKVCKA